MKQGTLKSVAGIPGVIGGDESAQQGFDVVEEVRWVHSSHGHLDNLHRSPWCVGWWAVPKTFIPNAFIPSVWSGHAVLVSWREVEALRLGNARQIKSPVRVCPGAPRVKNLPALVWRKILGHWAGMLAHWREVLDPKIPRQPIRTRR
jgi:hypothetical protein